MKMKSALLLAFLLSNTLAFAVAQIAKPAPDFEGKDIQGKTHRLGDYKGRIVVLETLNLDCPYSLHHYKSGAMPELQDWAASKGVIWFAVNSVPAQHKSHRSPEAAKKEWDKYKMKASAWLDDGAGAIGKAYGLKTTPHMVVIDQSGNVAYLGAIDDKPVAEGDPRQARNYVKEAVTKMVAGEKPAVTQTKPYGCAIKYAK